ncbi:hypothetical protein H2204_003871 [Knufia peltigerae]|uniref:Aminopeptidase n=1 Tax=Knufia peltigerae TaxID=1002370 RepID=A0AA39D1A7_9EURO|nr:hypothetical protein H2204_003871 [Knufia peltigerae]
MPLLLFNIELCEPWTYQGHVQIHLEIESATKSIVLNTQELVLSTAEVVTTTLKNERSVLQATKISYDHRNQRCTLEFEQKLQPTHESTTVLHISFKGTVNNQLTGFYRSSYENLDESAGDEDEGEDDDDDDDESQDTRFMLSTQFQPTYARRAFPCFDEPGLKATFDFAVEVPVELVALSNMQVKGERPGKNRNFKVVEFERTPLMSTYLLAWAIGDFEYIERFATRSGAPSYPVRLYTTKSLAEHGKFGIEVAIKALDILSKMFRIEYPLAKLDLLAVHGSADDAMENWGLLTFQITALLFDEKSSDPEYLTHVAYIVAHELAHQWFGNLVTMEWWNELWLNEAFATWAGWYVVDICYPEWNVWAQFVGESMQYAFHLDSLRASHPVEAPTVDALAVDSLFDDISYSKGSSLIRMLATYMGVDVFLKGVSEYLHKYAYGSTTAEQLWDALSRESELDVSAVMTPWIKAVGFPVIKVDEEGNNSPPHQLLIRQKRYLWDDFVSEAGEDTTIWWLPINTTPSPNVAQREQHPEAAAWPRENAKEAGIHVIAASEFRPLNTDQAGFYRTDWPPALVKKLEDMITSFSVQEQIGLLGDVVASASSTQGRMDSGGLLTFMQSFRTQDDIHIWNALLSSVSEIQSIFSVDAQMATGFRKFILDLTSIALKRLGWEMRCTTTASSTPLTARRLRGLLVLTAGLSGHKDLVSEALGHFDAYLDSDAVGATDPSLRRAVLSISVNSGGLEVFKAMKTAHSETELIDGEEVILNCLGQVATPELARRYLDWAFNGNIETEELACVIDGLAENSNPEVREVMWHFIKEKWGRIEKLYAGSLGIFAPILQRALETLVSDKIANDVKIFFEHKETAEYAQALAVGLETIAWRTKYLERDLDVVRDWLQSRGYMPADAK